MLFPRLFNDDVYDDIFDDFMPVSRPMFGKHERNWMKTDVKEVDGSYELDMDLPGFKKEDVKIELENGYLTITANKNHEVDNKDDKGNYIRKERHYGSCSRSFYVGDNVKHEDVKASFSDGVLRLVVPKKELPKVEEKKLISIE